MNTRRRKPSDVDASEAPAGAGYIAVVLLSNKAGDVTFADVGETCERVPESALGWLAEQGLIVPATPAAVED